MRNRKDKTGILDDLCLRFPDLSRTAIRLRMRRGDLVLLEIASGLQKQIDDKRAAARKAIAKTTADEIAVVCVEASGSMTTEAEAAEALRILSTPPTQEGGVI